MQFAILRKIRQKKGNLNSRLFSRNRLACIYNFLDPSIEIQTHRHSHTLMKVNSCCSAAREIRRAITILQIPAVSKKALVVDRQ